VITFWGISRKGAARSLKSAAIPSALMVSLFGKRIATLLQLLFVMTEMELWPLNSGKLIIVISEGVE
jgi:hypothetical protein